MITTLPKSGTKCHAQHSALAGLGSLDFDLTPAHEAGEPPEARGLSRDQVRLMVSYRSDDHIVHTCFAELPRFLRPGDVVVINTSGTLNAALNVEQDHGIPLELHLSTHLPADLWLVELRLPSATGTTPFLAAQSGQTLRLPARGSARLLAPYRNSPGSQQPGATNRLWVAALDLPGPLDDYLEHHGFPIRYGYVRSTWPSSYYQTVYATELGSAEMPSAGRAFTFELLTRLVAMGVQIAPLLLHTGVASLEEHEPPYEEFYRVPLETAQIVNAARTRGRRVIAVGTTVVRALETVTDVEGTTHPGEGWTREIITPRRGLRAIDALLTGLHEPRATHLAMLEALAGSRHLQVTYAAALQKGYLWHEFGDLHLLLP